MSPFDKFMDRIFSSGWSLAGIIAFALAMCYVFGD